MFFFVTNSEKKGEKMEIKITFKEILYFELKIDVYLFLKIVGYLFIFFK